MAEAVQRYLTRPWLRRYSFSTIAWQAMARGVASDYRAGERRRQAEQRYWEEATAPPPDLLEERLFLYDLMSAANSEQRRLVRSRLQGRSMAEAVLAQGMSVKQARRLLNELRRSYSATERGLKFHES